MALRSDDLHSVRALDLFAGASDETFRDLIAGAYLQRFPPTDDADPERRRHGLSARPDGRLGRVPGGDVAFEVPMAAKAEVRR
jgi:hypothetical protein